MCGLIKSCGKCLCSCAVGILKIIVIAFNIFFWVVGCALIALGTYLLIEGPGRDYGAITEGLSEGMWIAAMAIMISVGILMFVAGFLGCCGSCKESPSMLCGYSVLMILVLGAQCTIGYFIYRQVNEMNEFLGDNLASQVEYNYTGQADDAMTQAWDALQENLECCGAEDYTDYWGSYYESVTNYTVPASCCDSEKAGYDYNSCNAEATNGSLAINGTTTFLYLHEEGCYTKVTGWIDNYAMIVYLVIYIIAGLEFVCIIIGCCACCNMKNNKTSAAV